MSKYRIRELREDNDLTQKEVAKLLNTTQQHYSRIENETTEITADRVIKLADFYKVSTDYVLKHSEKKANKWESIELETYEKIKFYHKR